MLAATIAVLASGFVRESPIARLFEVRSGRSGSSALRGLAASAQPSAPPRTDVGASRAPAAETRPGAIVHAGQAVADRAAAMVPPQRTAAGVFATAATPELAQAAQTALMARLLARGFIRVVPVAAAGGPEAESRARALGLDVLVRVEATLQGADLVLAGDLVPTWENFWLGPGARGPGGGPLSGRAPADAESFALARVAPARRLLPSPDLPAPPPRLRPIARLAERVLALTAADLDGDGAAEIVVLTPADVQVLRGEGTVVARRGHGDLPRSPRPPRVPSGTVAVADLGGRRRIAFADFGRSGAELLAFEAGELRHEGPFDGVPACAGGAGLLVASAVAGKGLIADLAPAGGRPTAASARPAVSVTASPRPGPGPAFLALYPDGSGQLLTAELSPVGPPVPNLGAGSAIADLDGDGQIELVASLGSPGRDDHVRVQRVGRGTLAPVIDFPDVIPGELLAGAAGDLDGDGRDEVVLAAIVPAGSVLYRVGVEP